MRLNCKQFCNEVAKLKTAERHRMLVTRKAQDTDRALAAGKVPLGFVIASAQVTSRRISVNLVKA